MNGYFESPLIRTSKTDLCFSFYYYMFGYAHKIQLHQVNYNPGDVLYSNEIIWEKFGSHNDLWHRKFITIKPLDKDYSFLVSLNVFS